MQGLSIRETIVQTLVLLASAYALRRTVLVMILSVALPYVAQRWDRGRLAPAQRARAWNTASWGAALYAFGPFSMIGWCWVTRNDARRWWRESPPLAVAKGAGLLVAGVAAAVCLYLVILGFVSLHATLSGAPPEW
jgi:hypothetical protein